MHRDDEMRPGGGADADARHHQQFHRAGRPGQKAEEERGAGRPERSPGPSLPRPTTSRRGPPRRRRRSAPRERPRVIACSGWPQIAIRVSVWLKSGWSAIGSSSDLVGSLGLHRVCVIRRLLPDLALRQRLTALSGCKDRLSILHPAGPAAQTIAEIWWVMLIGGDSDLRSSSWACSLPHCSGDRRQADERSAASGIWLWGLGLGFPLVTLAALTAYGLVIGERLLAARRTRSGDGPGRGAAMGLDLRLCRCARPCDRRRPAHPRRAPGRCARSPAATSSIPSGCRVLRASSMRCPAM